MYVFVEYGNLVGLKNFVMMVLFVNSWIFEFIFIYLLFFCFCWLMVFFSEVKYFNDWYCDDIGSEEVEIEIEGNEEVGRLMRSEVWFFCGKL